jgi:hypothetical protein
VDKTTLMQIGNVNQLSEEILGLGFTSVQEVTLRGLVINRDLSSLSVYFDETLRKIS